MTPLIDAIHRHPRVAALVVLVVVCLLVYAADWFIGLAERDEDELGKVPR